jgi:hypothetical protein
MNSQQKSSNGASLGDEKAYLICPERINHPEMGLERLIELSTMSDGSTDPLCLVLPGLWEAGTWHTRASAARRSPPYGLIATPVQTNPSSAVKPIDR